MVSYFTPSLALMMFISLFLGAVHPQDEMQPNEKVSCADIIITVKTNVKILRQCVESLIRHAPDRNVLRQRVIFVDDGSPPETLSYVDALCAKNPADFICLQTLTRGYTHAVVQGVEYGSNEINSCSAIVLLNSDTVVTKGWLLMLHKSLMFNTNEKVMIVGPLSNAASFQSVPALKAYSELKGAPDWSTNPLPRGMNIDLLAAEVARISSQPDAVAEVPLMILNGFCFMFKRELISVIGNFDRTNFPSGYGEEVDFSIRAARAGFEGRIVTSSYVFHKKTASFQTSEKVALKKSSRKTLVELYGKQIFAQFDKKSRNMPDMRVVRGAVKAYYDKYSTNYADVELPGSILFALHDFGISGGVISVLSEAYQMRRSGVNASISVPEKAADGNPLAVARTLLPEASEDELRSLIILHPGSNKEPEPVDPRFVELAGSFDIVVATYCKTVPGVEAVVAKHPHVLLGYYAQDYEPWFWSNPFESERKGFWSNLLKSTGPGRNPHFLRAASSYEVANKGAFIICKTDWTCGMIEKKHNIKVHKVEPSMDHQLYYPNNSILSQKLSKSFDNNNVFRIVAMVRPRTARRNPHNTLDLLLRLAYNFANTVEITICGCTKSDLKSTLVELISDKARAPHRSLDMLFHRPNVHIANVVKSREDMANMLRSSDIFVDLSWWQAFGRSGMEAMACGCIAIMPLTGAADELCGENRSNCLVHDGTDENGYYSKVVNVLKDDEMRRRLIMNGIRRSWDFTLESSAMSIATQLKRGLRDKRKLNNAQY